MDPSKRSEVMEKILSNREARLKLAISKIETEELMETMQIHKLEREDIRISSLFKYTPTELLSK